MARLRSNLAYPRLARFARVPLLTPLTARWTISDSICHPQRRSSSLSVERSYNDTYPDTSNNTACTAHHQADSTARYFHFTLTQQTTITITLTTGNLYISKGTPNNGWGTTPKATYQHRINIRRQNGVLLHGGPPTTTLVLPPGTYTAEAIGTGNFTITITPP